MITYKEILEEKSKGLKLNEEIKSYKGLSKDNDMIFDLDKISSKPWNKEDIEKKFKKFKVKINNNIMYIPKKYKSDDDLMKLFSKYKFKK